MIDTHCHLDLPPLSDDPAGVLTDAHQAGVTDVVVPGLSPDGWRRIQAMSEQYRGVHAAYGIHPAHAGSADAAALDRLAEYAPRGIAIGEIGLDTVCTVPVEQQERIFRKQLELAVQLNLPVLVHCRRAFQRTLQILREEKAAQVGGIMHAYSGSCEMAREFARLNFAISLSGVLTRPDATRLHTTARDLPAELLVLESDAPDLPPWRYRGQSNRPAWLPETLRCAARLRGIPPEILADQCTANTRRVLRQVQGRTGLLT